MKLLIVTTNKEGSQVKMPRPNYWFKVASRLKRFCRSGVHSLDPVEPNAELIMVRNSDYFAWSIVHQGNAVAWYCLSVGEGVEGIEELKKCYTKVSHTYPAVGSEFPTIPDERPVLISVFIPGVENYVLSPILADLNVCLAWSLIAGHGST